MLLLTMQDLNKKGALHDESTVVAQTRTSRR